MPLYEFYCKDCHTIYSFLARCIDTTTTPLCPTCTRDSLTRQVSLFAAVTGKKGAERGEGGEGDDAMADLPIDETKMTRAMETLAAEAEHINEDDPRAAARLMRKLSDMTGLEYQGKIEEALTRMEAGEDPEAIEAQMGNALDNDEMPFVLGAKKIPGRKSPPRRDDTLYEM